MQRKIIHIDMDYFFAQVEEVYNPKLKNLPIAVGGKSRIKGVVCTCNYIARNYGVHSGMPVFQAVKLCPDLHLLPSRFKLYKKISHEIFKIFHNYTDQVEAVSCDEAYIDVSRSSKLKNSATLITQDMQKKILKETGLTASAGVSFNKLFAKIGSEMNKPRGLVVIPPSVSESFIKSLPLKVINGVGTKTQNKLESFGLKTFEDLRNFNESELQFHFGKFAKTLKNYSYGIDTREVLTERERKSLSVERTLEKNIKGAHNLLFYIDELYAQMERRLGKYIKRSVKSVFLKLKDEKFNITTIEDQSEHYKKEKYQELLLKKKLNENLGVRLIGIGVKFRKDPRFDRQLSLPCM